MSSIMIKLKRGFAPGLVQGRPHENGSPRYRWVPGPSLRRKGFRSVYLQGLPGLPLDARSWAGLGFAEAPDIALTHDGPALDLDQAAAACRALAAAARGAGTKTAPTPTRAAPITRSLNKALDHYFELAAAGKVTRRGKGGRPQAIRPKTIVGYKSAVQPIRDLAGDLPARSLRRAELAGLFEIMIDQGHHASAVAAQRAFGAAMNRLRKDPDWKWHLPPSEVYTSMGLGQPDGRLRMALPEEAEAMFIALSNPAQLAEELGLPKSEIPAAQPAAAAAWLMALWTVQRVQDTLSFTEVATSENRLRWRQSKTRQKINIPLLEHAQTARRLALASRPAGDHDGMLFINGESGRPYVLTSRKTGVSYHRAYNDHFQAARALAGLKVPSLLGGTKDPFGDEIPPLVSADSRDTGVTRLFEAMQHQDGALASISAWHGSSVETLIKLLRHYLVINPHFADTAGAALEHHAATMGVEV